jgi:hypothetical protein
VTAPTQTQLAMIAELRVWRLLLEADDGIAGMEPSLVYGHAVERARYLEDALADLDSDHPDALLEYSISQDQRDAAFLQASIAMKDVLSMIGSLSGLEIHHGIQ